MQTAPWAPGIQEFLGFLRLIERSAPEGLDVHRIVNNYCNHRRSLAFGHPRSGRSAPGWGIGAASASTIHPPTPPG